MSVTLQKRRIRWIIGGIVVTIAVIAVATLNFGDNLVYFYTPAEALAKADTLQNQTVKVGGLVKQGSKTWNPETLMLRFTLTDLEGHEIEVSHQGSPPDLFKEGQGAVVEGRIDSASRSFVAQRIMVKHSEEYKKPGDHKTMNEALMKDSLFKNENK